METSHLTLLTVNLSLLTAHYTLVLTTHWNPETSPPLKQAGYGCMSSSVRCATKFRVCSEDCSVQCAVWTIVFSVQGWRAAHWAYLELCRWSQLVLWFGLALAGACRTVLVYHSSACTVLPGRALCGPRRPCLCTAPTSTLIGNCVLLNVHDSGYAVHCLLCIKYAVYCSLHHTAGETVRAGLQRMNVDTTLH